MIPKFKYFRSKKHLKNVASLACQHCGLEGSTQAAHSNRLIHGKGRGVKASDEYTAALCIRCHFILDQGSKLTKEERVDMWEKAHRKTIERLIELDLWPDEVKI
jgi:ribosomal protein S27AE